MIIKFNNNCTMETTFTVDDFKNNDAFLKERLCSVYKFIKKRYRQFSAESMRKEKEKILQSKEYKALEKEQQSYICRFYNIAIKRLTNK